MGKYDRYFLMSAEDAKHYCVDVLHFFDSADCLEASEIGDGNINYVFRVQSRQDGRSVIVKQADTLLRSSGRPLDQNRNNIEAKILQFEGKYAPQFVPKVYYHDETMATTSMEDVSAYKNLRKELMEGRVYPHLAENISEFLALSLLPSTDLVLDKFEKKKLMGEFINPELCDITENLVLTDPYNDMRRKNRITPGNENFVEAFLYRDEQLHSEVGTLRERFMNYSQAMIHGDLHSGSIFANEDGIKVLDPEFAFYGPMGYDIGNVIGNLFFAWANKAYTQPENKEIQLRLEDCVRDVCDLTLSKLRKKYDESVTYPLYRTEAFRERYLRDIMADAYGYAGTEMIRRVVGASKVMEVTSVTDPAVKIPMERALIKMGIYLIKHRAGIRGGREVVEAFKCILA